jgi:hypothetical protein
MERKNLSTIRSTPQGSRAGPPPRKQPATVPEVTGMLRQLTVAPSASRDAPLANAARSGASVGQAVYTSSTGPAQAAYVVHVEAFNHNLKVLTRDLAARYHNDAMIYRAEKRVMAVINLDPLFVINEVGPYLYKYREQIYAIEQNSDAIEEFFLERSFEDEFEGSTNQEKVDMVQYIIPKAKECIRSLPAGDKGQIKGLIIDLLDDYVEYLAARKGL